MPTVVSGPTLRKPSSTSRACSLPLRADVVVAIPRLLSLDLGGTAISS